MTELMFDMYHKWTQEISMEYITISRLSIHFFHEYMIMIKGSADHTLS